MHAANGNDEPASSLSPLATGKPSPPLPSARHLRRRVRPNPYDIPTDPTERWEYFYSLLRMFYARHGHTSIPAGPAVDQSLLRNWCADQRKSYMKTLGVLDLGEKANWGTDYLDRDRKRRLDEAGFDWGHLDAAGTKDDDEIFSAEFRGKVRAYYEDWAWQSSLEDLGRYEKEHGHTCVPAERRGDLGSWAAQQRRLRDDMTAQRREALDALGFDWGWEQEQGGSQLMAVNVGAGGEKKAVMWPERIRQLKAFREENGHCDVPQDYGGPEGLGPWAARQRANSKLSPRSRVQLERMGFKVDI